MTLWLSLTAENDEINSNYKTWKSTQANHAPIHKPRHLPFPNFFLQPFEEIRRAVSKAHSYDDIDKDGSKRAHLPSFEMQNQDMHRFPKLETKKAPSKTATNWYFF